MLKVSNSRDFRFGLIGAGRWGMNYIRCISNMSNVSIRSVTSTNSNLISKSFPKMHITSEWRDICKDNSIDAIIIASPPTTHFEIAKYAMENEKPILAEKPFTLCEVKSKILRDLSKKKEVLCMVDYIHLFSFGYKYLKKNFNRLGKIKFVHSEGLNVGPVRKNIPVLWDWGCHELSMTIDLLNAYPISKKLKRLAGENSEKEISKIDLLFPGDISATCLFGNIAQFKRRDFNVMCESGLISYDGYSMAPPKIISKNFPVADDQFVLSERTPLENVIREFIELVTTDKKSHFTLDLAVKINELLSSLKYD